MLFLGFHGFSMEAIKVPTDTMPGQERRMMKTWECGPRSRGGLVKGCVFANIDIEKLRTFFPHFPVFYNFMSKDLV